MFLKYNNYLKGACRTASRRLPRLRRAGRYLAEVTKEVFDDLETNKYQFAEYRLSIYGKEPGEWKSLSAWVVDNRLFHRAFTPLRCRRWP